MTGQAACSCRGRRVATAAGRLCRLCRRLLGALVAGGQLEDARVKGDASDEVVH